MDEFHILPHAPAVCDGCHGKVAMATVEVEQAQAMAEVQQGVELA